MRGCIVVLALLWSFSACAQTAMQMLRPISKNLDAIERAALEKERDQVIAQGKPICREFSDIQQSCQGQVTNDCDARYRKMNDDLAGFNRATDDYNAHVVQAMRRHAEKMQPKVQSDMVAIKMLAFFKTATEFDNVMKMMKDVDEQRQKQVKEAFKEAGKTLAGEVLDKVVDVTGDKIRDLDPKAARQLIAKFKRAGADNPDLLEGIEALGDAKDKAAKVKAGKRLYEGLKKGKEIWDLHDIDDDNESELWKMGDELVENFVVDKRMKLVGKLTLNEVRATFYIFNETAIDMPIFTDWLDRFDHLTTSQFLALRSLSNLLHEHVKEKIAAQRELEDIDKQPAFEVCRPSADSGRPVAMSCGAARIPTGY
jgi:chemotaxis protein CheY-P-specific phosphatase CheC